MSRSALTLVRFDELSAASQQAVRELQISPQQAQYAGPNERAIARGHQPEHQAAGDAIGLAACVNERPVGYAVLLRRSAAPDWAPAHAASLSAMRIDQAHQGQGLGPLMLQALADWISGQWPDVQTLCLSVDEDNAAGIRAYEKAGFRDQGLRVAGRIGWVRYMARPVRPEGGHATQGYAAEQAFRQLGDDPAARLTAEPLQKPTGSEKSPAPPIGLQNAG